MSVYEKEKGGVKILSRGDLWLGNASIVHGRLRSGTLYVAYPSLPSTAQHEHVAVTSRKQTYYSTLSRLIFLECFTPDFLCLFFMQ